MTSIKANYYKPSWVNKVMDRLERFPLPLWVTYFLMYLISLFYVRSLYWIEGGALEEGTQAWTFAIAVWLPVGLGALHYLNIVARRAMNEFRPVVNCSDDEYNHIQYQMTRMPKSTILVFNGIMVVMFIVLVLDDPANLDPRITKSLSAAMLMIYMIFAFSFLLIFFYHTIRQLRLVSRLYGYVKRVNIFNLQPLYTLSGLTARTGIVWILFLSLNYFINFILVQGHMPNEVIFFLVFAQVVFATLVFLLPVWGIHVRIQDEKENMLTKYGERLRKTDIELHQLFEDKDLNSMEAYQKGISALISLRTEIEKTPTWPWRPATLRGFLSAVFLPLIIFVIQQLLLVGFFEF